MLPHADYCRYINRLFTLIFPPLVRYGIGLEAHGQNLVARINRQTGEITGFAVRDFGGVRMHVPTLRAHGVSFASLPSGGATLTDDLHNVWSKVHHALVQNHVGLLLSALGLETRSSRGWSIVRDTLEEVLRAEGEEGKKVWEFFMQDTMPFKCFLRMRMEGKYRDVSFLPFPSLFHGCAVANLDSMSIEKFQMCFLWIRRDGRRWSRYMSLCYIIHSPWIYVTCLSIHYAICNNY